MAVAKLVIINFVTVIFFIVNKKYVVYGGGRQLYYKSKFVNIRD